ncbi:hypothetical protein H2509_06865 [Stappia sp. F7233]|uniref:SH3 domain-containing protein n=1 Tax=Stappia albiluteola TaxID=2758565 RepID=A0A839ACU9_9HYPH|nr:hypothetical protein [Stappia albiluteola]MBA5776848.1 hypothetical protein [Stappia albiluteola]
MLAYPKQSAPEELEYHSLRVINDCTILKSIEPPAQGDAYRQLAEKAVAEHRPDEHDGDDQFLEPTEAAAEKAQRGLFAHFYRRRVALVSAAAILLATGAGLATTLTVSIPDPAETAAPGQAASAQHQATETATPEAAVDVLPSEAFDDRFATASADSDLGIDLQAHVQRQPVADTAEEPANIAGTDLGIVHHTKPVKTIAIKPDVSPVLGYVSAGDKAPVTEADSAAAQRAIVDATKRNATATGTTVQTVDRTSDVEIASSDPAPTAEPATTAAEPAPVAEPQPVTEQAPPAAPVVEEQVAEPEKVQSASDETKTGQVTISVNLREGKSNDAKVLKILPAKTTVTLGNCDRWWCEATHSGQTGFIGKRYIDVES